MCGRGMLAGLACPRWLEVAREAPPRRGDSSLYEWLLRREEEAARQGGSLPWTPEQPGYTGSAERLAALRAGEVVNIPAGALPRRLRADEVYSVWHRAVVSPAGLVRIEVDNGSLWLAEHGL